jgi:hypothetical protein
MQIRGPLEHPVVEIFPQIHFQADQLRQSSRGELLAGAFGDRGPIVARIQARGVVFGAASPKQRDQFAGG